MIPTGRENGLRALDGGHQLGGLLALNTRTQSATATKSRSGAGCSAGRRATGSAGAGLSRSLQSHPAAHRNAIHQSTREGRQTRSSERTRARTCAGPMPWCEGWQLTPAKSLPDADRWITAHEPVSATGKTGDVSSFPKRPTVGRAGATQAGQATAQSTQGDHTQGTGQQRQMAREREREGKQAWTPYPSRTQWRRTWWPRGP